MSHCIWCKNKVVDFTTEHIIPEALGCPSGFVLSNGAVCRSCNNDLAHLDRAVIDDFDILAFMATVPRKRGKSPIISSRGNMVGICNEAGNYIAINMESSPVRDVNGRILGGFGKSRRNIRAKFNRFGSVGRISFDTTLGDSPKFVRGIVKIAFSSLAYFLGSELALRRSFDPVRSFVMEGIGRRRVLLMQTRDVNYRNQVWPPYKNEKEEYSVVFRLASIEFFVDLSPSMSLFPVMKQKAKEIYGESGWTFLPV